MSGGSQLLVRPAIRDEECLVDFSARVAFRNGLSPTNVYSLLRDRKSCRRLLPIAGDLTTSDVSQPLGKRVWRGKEFKRTEILFERAAVCPQCLAESEYRPMVWRFWAKAYCVEHAVRLIDRCDRCGASSARNSSELVRCVCGDDLRRHPAPPANDPELLAFQKAVDAAFAIHLGLPAATTTHPASALLCARGGLNLLVHARPLALLSQGGASSTGRGILERSAAVAALAQLFKDGTTSVLQEARGRWAAVRARKVRTLADASHDALVTLTRFCERAPADSEMRRLATALTEIRDDTADAQRFAARLAKPADALLTLRDAAALAGLDVVDLRKLVSSGQVPHVRGRRLARGHLRLLERSVVAQLCEFRLKLLRMDEVAGMLGIDAAQAKALRRKQIVSCAWNTKRYAQSEVPLSQILRLTARLSELAQEPHQNLAGQLIALNRVTHDQSRSEAFASTLLKALRGEVEVYKTDPAAVGLGQWSVVMPQARQCKAARQ